MRQETDEAGRGTAQLPYHRTPIQAAHKGTSPSGKLRNRVGTIDMEHLEKLWIAALAQEHGLAIEVDDRKLLQQQLYRYRQEEGDGRFDDLVILMPEGKDELWIGKRDNATG